MYMLSFYVPESHLEPVKIAIFTAGAGQVGAYSHCAWQTLGQGQFMPLSGSQAFVGSVNQVESLPEYKVEVVCNDECVHAVVAALKLAHPYETVAYQVWKLEAI